MFNEGMFLIVTYTFYLKSIWPDSLSAIICDTSFSLPYLGNLWILEFHLVKKINYFLLFSNKNILTFLFEKQEYLLLKRVEL